MSELNKSKTLLYAVITTLFIGLVVVGLINSQEIEASSTKILEGTMYKTPSGDIVEVVEVPDFGKCFITPVMVYCK